MCANKEKATFSYTQAGVKTETPVNVPAGLDGNAGNAAARPSLKAALGTAAAAAVLLPVLL